MAEIGDERGSAVVERPVACGGSWSFRPDYIPFGFRFRIVRGLLAPRGEPKQLWFQLGRLWCP